MGRGKRCVKKCGIKKRETLKHWNMYSESSKYKRERTNFETEVIRSVGNREWKAIKQNEDKIMKEILGLGDYGQKMMDITKTYLNTIWKKRKLNNKGRATRALKTSCY